MPGLYKGYPESLKKKDSEERDHTDPMHKPEAAEKAREKAEAASDEKKEKSYSQDDVTVAYLLKGRSNAQELFDLAKAPVIGGSIYAGRTMPKDLSPSEGKVIAAQTAKKPGGLTGGASEELKSRAAKEKQTMMDTAQARLRAQTAAVKSEEPYSLDFSKSILDKMGLTKAKKETNESGEEFQDGSEDTIGAEGHAATARPIAHEGGGQGPDHPGTKTKRASQEDGDLQKSDNLTDNLPEEFEEGIEDADTIPNEDEKAAVEGKKSFTYDEMNAAILLKSSPFAQEIVDLIKAARDEEAARDYKYNAWRKRSDVRAAKWKSGIDATKRAVQHFKNKADLAEEDEAGKSEGEGDLEKSHTSRVGNASPTKGAAGRHFAREAREDQKKEDAKYRIPRHASVLGSGGEVTNVSDKVIRVRPAQGGTVGSEAKIKSVCELNNILEKAVEKKPKSRGPGIDYISESKMNKPNVKVTGEKMHGREIPANAAHEKELKEASLHTELDSLLEKARRPSWDPKPKHVDEDKEAFHADSLSGDAGSREHEYKRKQELADKWQAKKNSPEFRTASKIKDADEGDD
jgi:hypothetical protein